LRIVDTITLSALSDPNEEFRYYPCWACLGRSRQAPVFQHSRFFITSSDNLQRASVPGKARLPPELFKADSVVSPFCQDDLLTVSVDHSDPNNFFIISSHSTLFTMSALPDIIPLEYCDPDKAKPPKRVKHKA
jgi:hypothetical protein